MQETGRIDDDPVGAFRLIVAPQNCSCRCSACLDKPTLTGRRVSQNLKVWYSATQAGCQSASPRQLIAAPQADQDTGSPPAFLPTTPHFRAAEAPHWDFQIPGSSEPLDVDAAVGWSRVGFVSSRWEIPAAVWH